MWDAMRPATGIVWRLPAGHCPFRGAAPGNRPGTAPPTGPVRARRHPGHGVIGVDELPLVNPGGDQFPKELDLPDRILDNVNERLYLRREASSRAEGMAAHLAEVPGDAAVTVADQNGGPSGSHQGSGSNGSGSKSSGSRTATSRSRRGRSAQTWLW
jgi:hypothetical protein